MAGFGEAELLEAVADRFGDIGALQDIALNLCALQESFAVRVDNPALVVFADSKHGDTDARAAREVATASDVAFHTVQVSQKGDTLDMEQCLQAIHHGRDAIKALLADGGHRAISIVGLPTSSDLASLVSANLFLSSSKDASKSTSPILKLDNPMAMLTATHSYIIATICGAIVEAASHKVPVVFDGVAAIVAAIAATRMAPQATRHSLFAVRAVDAWNESDQPRLVLDSIMKGLAITTLPLPRLGPCTGGLHGLTLLRSAARLVSALDLHVPVPPDDESTAPPPATTSSVRAAYVDGSLPPPPELRIFLTSVMFLTRLPAYLIIPDLDHNVRELVPSFCYFPLIGWGVGAFAALWLVLGRVFFGSTAIAVILSTFASVWLTGCFHEDGVADSFDSFGGGWSKDDILRIMKDSRLGTYGCMGLLLMTTLKFAALAHLVDTSAAGVSSVACALVAGHVLGRYSSLFILQFYPYVEDERDPKGPLYNGIGNNVHLLTPWRVWSATIFTAVSMVVLLGPALGLCVLSVGLLVSFLSGQYFAGFLGGVIGDCLGCANQVVEIVVYLTIGGILNSAGTQFCFGG